MSAFAGKIAAATPKSGNGKTGPVAVTTAGFGSCPESCALRAVCYAGKGRMAMLMRDLTDAAAGLEPEAIAAAEARAIDADAKPVSRAMRLHQGGDCRTDAAARIVADAAARWSARCRERHGADAGTVWTYTHAWRDVSRVSWGAVAVLASCESVDDCREALARGYAPALVIAESAPVPEAPGFRFVACRNDKSQDTQCVSCKVCWRADALAKSRSVVVLREI